MQVRIWPNAEWKTVNNKKTSARGGSGALFLVYMTYLYNSAFRHPYGAPQPLEVPYPSAAKQVRMTDISCCAIASSSPRRELLI